MHGLNTTDIFVTAIPFVCLVIVLIYSFFVPPISRVPKRPKKRNSDGVLRNTTK
jgi:F0F1-type ATP synthase membrane subunit b/b'